MDVQTYVIGLLSGWASAYAVYRFRHVVSSVADSARAQAVSARTSATLAADSRYINDLIARCENTHLAGQFLKLTDVLVEPRFVMAPEPVGPPDEDVLYDVFQVIPRIHDMPFLHGPYNIPAISISELGDGSRAVALLGLPGSGRTTALQTIALFSLNRVHFSAPTDAVQHIIDEEEAKLSDKDRKRVAQERVRIEAEAREKLAREGGITFESADEEAKQAVPTFNRLMPVYIHFAFFAFDQIRGDLDPAEPLVRALQASVRGITAKSMPRSIYERLEQGKTLLLLDGYDELPAAVQPKALAWLQAFLQQYGENFVIVTGSAQGYGALLNAGLAPVFMRPWQDLDIDRAVDLWAKAFPRMGGRRLVGNRKIGEEDVAVARSDSRGLTPLEITLKIWSAYAEPEAATTIQDWFALYIQRHLTRKMPMDGDPMPVLTAIAALQVEDGYITRARMEALGIGGEAVPEATTPEDALREAVAPDTKGVAKAAQKVAHDARQNVSSIQAKWLAAFKRTGLIIHVGRERYRFRHDYIAAYLASFELCKQPAEQIHEHSLQSDWHSTVTCMALHTSIDALVKSRLNVTTDILHSTLVELARWLKYAPQDAPWRGHVLRLFSQSFIVPNQYPLVRKRAAAALVAARDPSVGFIFRKAARSADALIRSLACLGLGAIGNPDGIGDLEALLHDRESDIQLASAMALGAIATEEALDAMLQAFTSDSEPVRKAIAEAFAALPDQGHPTLYDAVHSDDMLMRRAAVMGIRRIRANWARSEIYRTFLRDEEWYVRSAAETAFYETHLGQAVRVVESYPLPENIQWLNEWAARRGETMEPGDQALQLLILALRDSEPQIRALAAATLGQLGVLDTLNVLYQSLLDGHDQVRSVSFEALADVQMRLGRPLPAPAR
ncbi:MAG: HEAT repeat domain-containing protein [Anaerolineae bacterium]|nr:HEAT repeat domain-containing protein [Anaerolineae bacterium]